MADEKHWAPLSGRAAVFALSDRSRCYFLAAMMPVEYPPAPLPLSILLLSMAVGDVTLYFLLRVRGLGTVNN